MVDRKATNLDVQRQWIGNEMCYSLDKTHGYRQKEVRLARHPSDSQSVYGFMSGYWQRLQILAEAIDEGVNQDLVTKALQLDAKVVAGLCDKVAFTYWLEGEWSNTDLDKEYCINSGLALVVYSLSSQQVGEYAGDHARHPFKENPMGRSILKLHEIYEQTPTNISQMRDVVVGGAVSGMMMLQSYASGLQEKGYNIDLPRPGVGSGIIEPWV